MEANQAVYLLNVDSVGDAVPHMLKALELDVALPQGAEFRRLLAEHGL
jgi:hypothetical protein